MNSAAAGLLGESAELLAGRSLRELLPDCTPEHLARERRHLAAPAQSSRRGESPGHAWCELHGCDPDWRRFWSWRSARTARRSSASTSPRTFYRRLWAQAAVGLATLDPGTGHIQQCNHQFARMLGFPAGALVGRRLTQLLHGDDQAANDALMAGLTEGKRDRYELECLAYRQGGTLACVHLVVSSIRDAAGTPVCTMAVAHDVTAQRQEERRLQAAEGRFRLLFEQNVAGMLRTTVDGKILECNEAFARMLGYGYPAQVLERPAEDLFSSGGESRRLHCRAAAACSPPQPRGRAQAPGRLHLWCLLNATLAPDPEGNLTIIEGSAIDITDRRRAEEQLRIQRDLAHALATVTSIEDAAQVCLDAAIQASGMDAGGFYIFDPATGCLNLAAWQGVSEEFARSVAVIAPDDPRQKTVSLASSCSPVCATSPEQR